MIRRPWTNHEDRELLRLLERGFENKEIALKIGRSYGAISTRLNSKGISRRARRHSACEMVRIASADVATWYALGWRFCDFDDGACVFGWPHKSSPEYPEIAQREAA